MRALVITLMFVAAPIYFAAAMLDDHAGPGGFASFRDLRDELAASDAAHDTLDEARDYAAAHPELAQGIKAHRAELEALRQRLCGAVAC